jgi:hypothetical protein
MIVGNGRQTNRMADVGSGSLGRGDTTAIALVARSAVARNEPEPDVGSHRETTTSVTAAAAATGIHGKRRARAGVGALAAARDTATSSARQTVQSAMCDSTCDRAAADSALST